MKEVNLMNIVYAGIGAIAEGVEKSKQVFDEMIIKGQDAFEKGKVLNEELKHNIKEKIKDNVTIVETKVDNETILKAMDNMSDEELKAIKEKIDKMEKKGEGEKK